ncbi:MAG: sigma-70 family RNA polymerase sigma factor [Gemmatimonadetes bacterium]|jgi:RNA polymerase sigma-70 factor (ECF subfamily)|nr:sigma-70 family RNA polymerase sigma factor [Gemmatimonadota bacterium]MBP9201672.1 sigma-70 family RNA polymerase sigma factor [Gemmatimonadales bacterium]MBK6780475.1 sigma-70 family RNA polymerase sigma factor [Gemmatimonadota bacterium]MBK7715196.1 sigma-70 family RNA polymerase sigma factor [Gemmatimonadota bacterium]MBK9065764.1 sigma-70 family RNA polymerase sigma factor [Gemmatimonadota bacterium]
MSQVPIEELFAQFHQPLVRMLYRRTGDQDRAEDLAAEVFARALASPPDNPRPWLFAVALNLVRDDGRRAVRQGRRLQLLKGESPTSASPADEDYERTQKTRAVQAALAEMRDLDREVLLLKAEGFDYDEIAAATGLAKGAIGTTICRARKRLVELVRAQEKDRHVAS